MDVLKLKDRIDKKEQQLRKDEARLETLKEEIEKKYDCTSIEGLEEYLEGLEERVQEKKDRREVLKEQLEKLIEAEFPELREV